MARFFVLLLVLVGLASNAQQRKFNKELDSDMINFNYQWIDLDNTTQNLAFSLTKKSVYQQKHLRFVPELAQKFMYIELLKAARKVDPREARIEIQQVAQDVRVKINSRSTTLIEHWQMSMQTSKQLAYEHYLEKNYYTYFKTPFGQQGIKPDHIRYIDENKLALLPVATAIYNQLPADSPPADYVNLILSWVQSIPYNTLENRAESNGAGYLPPLSVIANNQGDCDSKSALTAGIIRVLLPEVKILMMYLPNHALLGIGLPHLLKKDIFVVDGFNYVLMEPTGPATMPLGTIASKSTQQLASAMFSYEEVN